MSSRDIDPRWPTDNTGLALLVVVCVGVTALIILTQLAYILLAIILAYVLLPIQRRLEQHLNPGLAALSLTVLSIVLLLIFITYIITIAIQQGLALASAIQAGEFTPDSLQTQITVTGYVVDLEQLYATFQEPIATGVEWLATGALTTLGDLPGLLIGLTVTTFVLFVLLRDGDRFLAWLRVVVPVSADVQRELLVELDDLMWASVVGNVAVAGIQAGLLGVGLVLVGMPGVIFLIIVTFVLCLLPLVGAFGVWVPVSIYLFLLGRPLSAVSIVAIGSVVSASDLYLRPAIINRSGALNVAVITVGIFGGIVVFGAIGLFIGPVVIGGTKIVIDQFARERDAVKTG